MDPLPLNSTCRRSLTSRFKEHLSWSLQPFPVEVSHSPTDSFSLPLHTASSTFVGSSRQDDLPRDVESISNSSRTRRQTFRDRFTRMFFDVRSIERGKESDLISIHPRPELSEWPPLHVEKKHAREDHTLKKDKHKSRRLWIIYLIVILLFLVGNVIYLNVRIADLSTKITLQTTRSSVSSTSLSFDAQDCISQFSLNAPSSPSSYPCGSCLTALSGARSNTTTQNSQQVTNALQFCGLRAVFDSADSNGQTTLQSGGWATNVNFCTWQGVSCNSSGMVNYLTLTSPGVPATLPAELGNLIGMQSLQVIGDGNVPAGSVPSSFQNLTSLTTLHLESTAITTFPNNLFSSLNKVSNLTFVSNSKLSADLTPITQLPLQILIIQRQFISNPLSDLASSPELQSSLSVLDLCWNSFSGTIPSNISSLSSLKELHLDGNNLQPPLPSAFPSNLQDLTMTNNTALSGTMPNSFCSSQSVLQCDLMNTNLSVTGCGKCQF